LSDRELEIMDLIGSGLGTKAIADKLKLSAKTIDSYREYLDLKDKLSGSSELVRRAIQWAQDDR
jgi:DNA-binding CsgD family transcriptional regulator